MKSGSIAFIPLLEQTGHMNGRSLAILLFVLAAGAASAQESSEPERHAPVLVEKVTLDWDHSETPTTFTLSFQHRTVGTGDADRLVIRRGGAKPWILLNNDDEWDSLKSQITPELLKTSVVVSKRMLFFKSGPEPNARTYLILKGGGYGCCVGSLTVITCGQNGTPKIVFHSPPTPFGRSAP
ncbi:MAG: hypothetical protein ABR976_13025 [Terracidiphilus sp.]|jgi:hypothetical protein